MQATITPPTSMPSPMAPSAWPTSWVSAWSNTKPLLPMLRRAAMEPITARIRFSPTMIAPAITGPQKNPPRFSQYCAAAAT